MIKDESGFDNDKNAAKDFLAAAANRSGLLEERGGQYGFFTHKTFHEFLTGLHLAQNKRKEWPTLLAQRVRDDQWPEVIALAAGALADLNAEDANDFVELLGGLGADSSDPLRLAGLERAALAQADFPDDRAQKNRKSLIARLETLMVNLNLSPAQRRPLGLALSALSDPRFIKPIWERDFESEFPLIPAGEFRMGTSADDEKLLAEQNGSTYADEKPDHRVYVSAYRLAKFPVTNADFRRFVNDNGYDPNKSWWQDEALQWIERKLKLPDYAWVKERVAKPYTQPAYFDHPKWNADNLPVVGVTWFEAQAYCRWLTVRLRERKLIGPDYEIRLPTEAEWEKAARSAPLSPTKHPEQSGDASRRVVEGTGGEGLWPWGDTWDKDRCNNSDETGFGATTPVGLYPNGVNAYGIHDLIGNVWEWCADSWDDETYKKRGDVLTTDPLILNSSGERVLRGGSWYYYRHDCRAAYRARLDAWNFDGDGGFRLVLSPTRV